MDISRDMPAFASLMNAVCDRFGRTPLSANAVRLSFDVLNTALKDVTLTELSAAISELIADCGSVPTDADIISAVRRRRPHPLREPESWEYPPRTADEERESRRQYVKARERMMALRRSAGSMFQSIDDAVAVKPVPMTPEEREERKRELARQAEVLKAEC